MKRDLFYPSSKSYCNVGVFLDPCPQIGPKPLRPQSQNMIHHNQIMCFFPVLIIFQRKSGFCYSMKRGLYWASKSQSCSPQHRKRCIKKQREIEIRNISKGSSDKKVSSGNSKSMQEEKGKIRVGIRGALVIMHVKITVESKRNAMTFILHWAFP